MAVCRASGHVLVITICHWFSVSADTDTDARRSRFPLDSHYDEALLSWSLSLSCCCSMSSTSSTSSTSSLSLSSSSAFGPWYIMACRLSCLFALFSKTWQQQLPLVLFLLLALGAFFLLLWRIFCNAGNWDIFFPSFFFFVIYCIGLSRMHFKLIEYLAKCLLALPSKLFTGSADAFSRIFTAPSSIDFGSYQSKKKRKKKVNFVNQHERLNPNWMNSTPKRISRVYFFFYIFFCIISKKKRRKTGKTLPKRKHQRKFTHFSHFYAPKHSPIAGGEMTTQPNRLKAQVNSAPLRSEGPKRPKKRKLKNAAAAAARAIIKPKPRVQKEGENKKKQNQANQCEWLNRDYRRASVCVRMCVCVDVCVQGRVSCHGQSSATLEVIM